MLNTTIFSFLNGLIFHHTIFDNAIFFMAVTLPYIIFGSAFLFLLFVPTLKDNPKWWYGLPRRALKCIHAMLAVGISYLIASIMKTSFQIMRPFEGPNGVHSLFPHSGGDSFPSGHATAFAALATIMYFHYRPAGVLFWIAAILIAISRVIAGVHYPVDIAAGLILGGLIGFLMNRLWVKISKVTTV